MGAVDFEANGLILMFLVLYDLNNIHKRSAELFWSKWQILSYPNGRGRACTTSSIQEFYIEYCSVAGQVCKISYFPVYGPDRQAAAAWDILIQT